MGQLDYYVEPGNDVQLVADVVRNMTSGIKTIWLRGDKLTFSKLTTQRAQTKASKCVKELFEYNDNLLVAGILFHFHI